MLPRIYARAPLSAELMGSLVETIAKIGLGTDAEQGRDILGRTYEYFIREFARAEGHRGGEFFMPAPVARLLVEDGSGFPYGKISAMGARASRFLPDRALFL